MRGASVNFQKIHSALHAVAHASRRVPPQYLLPAEHSLGTHVVIDDMGEVQKKLAEKMALASRQAKASKDYSPLWEGVINLPHPSKSITAQHQIQIVKAWCEQYEAITGHKILRADVHLDEGFLNGAGEAQFNAHAHVMCDRTDAAGKVIKLSPKQLREVQGMTAEVTQLQRGKDARKTGRQHLNHVQYRFAAEQGRQQLEQSKAQSGLIFDIQAGLLKEQQTKAKNFAVELAEAKALAEQYKAERDALKKSGTAQQKDYQDLKAQYEAANAALTKAEAEATQAKARAAAVQQQLQKATAIANKNYEIATTAKAQLEAAQEEVKEAKAGLRLFNDELERTTKELIEAQQKLYNSHDPSKQEIAALEATEQQRPLMSFEQRRLESLKQQPPPPPSTTPEKPRQAPKNTPSRDDGMDFGR